MTTGCKSKRGYTTAFSARVTTFHAVRSDPDSASASSLGVPMAPWSELSKCPREKSGAKMAADANSSQLDHYANDHIMIIHYYMHSYAICILPKSSGHIGMPTSTKPWPSPLNKEPSTISTQVQQCLTINSPSDGEAEPLHRWPKQLLLQC